MIDCLLFIALPMYLFSLLMLKNKKFSIVITVALLVSYIFAYDTVTWFGEAKRWVISIPLLYIAVILYYLDNEQFVDSQYFRYIKFSFYAILFVNVFLVAPPEIYADNVYSKINGFILILTTLITPTLWHIDNERRTLGFHDWEWVMLSSSCIAFFYITNPIINAIGLSVTMSLLVSVVAMMYYRDSVYWFVFRAYSLCYLMILRAHAPNVLYGLNVQIILDDNFKAMWMVINIGLLIWCLLRNAHKLTLMNRKPKIFAGI